MKVLVSAASKYGATSEIAQAVAEVLAGRGLEVTMLPPQEVGAVEEFDAVVLGSAVYMGQWMRPARELAERSAAALAARPVWLFSSGPVGEPAKPADNPVDVTKIVQATKARDHQIFTGKLVKKHLSFPDRGHGLGHPRRRGRLPQLGRNQGLGIRHRRHPALLTSALRSWFASAGCRPVPGAAAASQGPYISAA